MKKALTLFLYLIFATIVLGQTVSGVILDETGQAIIGANIFNIGEDSHAHSRENGAFQIRQVSSGDTLIVSHLNYFAQELVIANPSEKITIVLEEKSIDLDQVVISPDLNAVNLITDIDLTINPVNSSQEVLRKVPGLFIGQHAGGGKAEQIFLRGFDIDHGTDIAISVDGIPVNMVSHAHGQGYADLHFVIPETIKNIDFGKGTYYSDKGNFNTAGFVGFNTKDRIRNNLLKFEVGQFNTQRLMGMFKLVDKEKTHMYLASEYMGSDGAFESPQNFSRLNFLAKLNTQVSETDKLELSVSQFLSEWDASGQIPQRAVNNGSISRFGAIDDTEGGTTSRLNAIVKHTKNIDPNSVLKSSIYYSKYDFELFSNFTFFLEDPENGDQIKQHETRDMFGFNTEYKRFWSKEKYDASWTLGLNLRNDRIDDNELSRTKNRTETLEQIQFGKVNESNLAAYTGASFTFGDWTLLPGLRLDYFDFAYNDRLSTTYSNKSISKTVVNPKLNILYNYSNDVQWYLKLGRGFHSNDSRVVLENSADKIIPLAYGADFGFIWKPLPRLILNTGLWYLLLEQEFVYVGDAGIVEPSGQTSRYGFDIEMRYQAKDWLFLSFDGNYAHARSDEEEDGANFIPLAPSLTMVGGIDIQHKSGFFAGLDLRFIDDRPANEDNTIIAEGYSVVDMTSGYGWDRLRLSFQIQNLFDVDWNETQFATESRLQNEIQSIEEIHFTPGTPFFFRLVGEYNF